MNMKIEIEFQDGTLEQCHVLKQYGNRDFQLDRKKRRRLELVSGYDEEYLRYKYRNERYIFVNAYLKDTKGYDCVRVRRVEE